MADFSLTTLFVAPVAQEALPSSGSTQDLTAGQLGIFLPDYTLGTAGNIAAANYFYVAQGRSNTYLQGSKRSDKISGAQQAGDKNVIEYYKVVGNPVAVNQITEVSSFTVKPETDVSLTIRAHSSYLSTLYFNGWTKSVTVPGECLTCGGDPCVNVDAETIVDNLITELAREAEGINPDNMAFSKFFRWEKIGTGANAKLVLEGKPLTAYGQPCDVSAFPHEYDRMWFDVFVYAGPDTTADFIVSDACESVATVTKTQSSNYPSGTSEEIKQLEKNFHSYQAGYLKHLHKQVGYNGNFESYVTDGTTYSTYYIKFFDYHKNAENWSDYVRGDSTVIIAVPKGSAFETAIEAVLAAALGSIAGDNTVVTTTTTTTAAPTTTTTTTAAPTTTTTTTVP